MTEEQQGDTSYFSIIPPDWLDGPEIRGVVIRGYASGIAEYPDLCSIAFVAINSFITTSPGKFIVSFLTIAQPEPVRVMDEVMTFHGGAMRVNVNIRPGTVPAGHYACIAVPMFDENEDYITRRTESIRGLLTLVAGHTAMLEMVFEQRFDISQPHQVARVGRTVEAHLHPNQWRVFSEATIDAAGGAFQGSSDELRDRAALAFSFIARSTNVIDHTVRFANAWIAFEVMAGGHAGAKNFLNGLDAQFGREAKRFIDMRNALFHHGKRPVFEQSDEHFLCACIMALLLEQLGVKDAGFSTLVRDHLANHPPA